jgi:hypothetical protein
MAKSVLSAPPFQNEEAAFEYVEKQLWPTGPVCPHCGERKRIGRLNGKTTRPGLRKCGIMYQTHLAAESPCWPPDGGGSDYMAGTSLRCGGCR